MNKSEKNHPILKYFIDNPISTNLLMLSIVLCGLYIVGFFGLFSKQGINVSIDLESFPTFDSDSVTITASINSSTAEDVEKGVTNKIEEAIKGVQGIDEYTSVSSANSASIKVKAKTKYNLKTLLDDIQSEVDTITNLPNEVEKVIVKEDKSTRRILWASISSSGLNEKQLRDTARELRDRMLDSDYINNIDIRGEKEDEVRIEVNEENLYKYKVSFSDIKNAISRNSFDLAVGTIESSQGDITLRISEQAYNKEEFENIVVRTKEDGSQIKVKDIAVVRDGFSEQEIISTLNGEDALTVEVRSLGDVNVIAASKEARSIAKDFSEDYPHINIELWNDSTSHVKERLEFFQESSITGMFLVFLMLALFLNIKLAFWVAIGIPISFFGALILMLYQDISISLISLFGFIAVLGIVVDDAIVIGESIYSEKYRTNNSKDATYKGLVKVSTPATFGVLTTIAAFLPLTQLTGKIDSLMGQIAYVIIFCLIFSLVESKLILPSHLNHIKVSKDTSPKNFWEHIQKKVETGLRLFINKVYLPGLSYSIRHRYIVLTSFILIFFLAVSLVLSGVIKTQIMPQVESDNIRLLVTMESTVSGDATRKYGRLTAKKASEVREDLIKEGLTINGADPVKDIYLSSSSDKNFYIFIVLAKSDDRLFTNDDFARRWRKKIGYIEGSKSIDFITRQRFTNADVEIEIYSNDFDKADRVSKKVQDRLETLSGVQDISTDLNDGQPEIEIKLKPEAYIYGISKNDIATEVRSAFYGAETQRIQRKEDEVRVMVSYPKEERKSFSDLTRLYIRTDSGKRIPITSLADLNFSSGYTSINHINGKVAITVLASIDKKVTSAAKINKELNHNNWLDNLAKTEGVTYFTGGESEANKKSERELGIGFISSLLMIYCLLAIPLKSYTKPFIIISVIPFGIIGAILGHLIVGKELTMLSFFGILALSGVVVNDSLVFVSTLSEYKKQKMPLPKAIILTGKTRFRPIILTSLTTFMGLTPILLETSLQAQFLIPMAISLSFGILFATAITLLLLPILYYIVSDFRRLFHKNPSTLT